MKKISLLLVFLMLLSLFCGCDSTENLSQTESGHTVPFTVRVMTEGGMVMDETEIRIYEKGREDDLVWAGVTDDEGYVNFKADCSKSYIAKIKNLPEGYKNEEIYDISEDSVVSVKTELLDGFFQRKYRVGDIARDFTITDVNGDSYNLKQFLQDKKAVVLNLWFIGCGPCRMEFPYLQSAYDQYKDDIAVIGLNPIDGTDATVSLYASQMEITFPMSACEMDWASCFSVTGYPTTVVIDRYGMISMIHMGAVTESGVFEKIFEYYTSDDYVQSVVRNINGLK